MGELLIAQCVCGYQSQVLQLGLGFRYFENKMYYEAAYCDHCGEVKALHGGKSLLKCSRCRKGMRYYREDLSKPPKHHFGEIPNTEYLEQRRKYWHCPSCKECKLTFNNHGCWD